MTTFDPATIHTIDTEITYHFKAFGKDKEQYTKLAALVEAGKLDASDLEQKEDDKVKRKSLVVKVALPVIAIEGFTPEMNAHVQFLIAKQVEAKNKDNVDECTGEWIDWYTVLAQPPINRSAGAIKVTAEMVTLVTDALVEYMTEQGYPLPAIELIKEAGNKRFSATVCRDVKTAVLHKINAIVSGWIEALDEETAETVAPVTNLWIANIDKVLNPKTDVTADMFEL